MFEFLDFNYFLSFFFLIFKLDKNNQVRKMLMLSCFEHGHFIYFVSIQSRSNCFCIEKKISREIQLASCFIIIFLFYFNCILFLNNFGNYSFHFCFYFNVLIILVLLFHEKRLGSVVVVVFSAKSFKESS